MKFIKTISGDYINPALVEYFSTGDDSAHKGAVFAHFSRGRRIIKEFRCDPKSTTQFDPKEAAQAWLDDFVAELNGEQNESE